MKKLKHLVKEPFLVLFRIKWIYKVIKWIYVLAEYEQCKLISYGKNETLEKIFSDLTVKNGPFKGMKYPEFISCGSSIYPKLLGYYEPELEPILHAINNIKYSEILDVGCAEGYYAVGLAMKHPESKVLAFDTNKIALTQCQKMAELNLVSHQLTIGGFFNSENLRDFIFTNRGLVICDCEGYEKLLFDKLNIGNLRNVDVLIELHDFTDCNISSYLINLFNETHDLIITRSMDDSLKMNKQLSDIGYNEIKHLNFEDKFQAVAECRRYTMEWAYFTPKLSAK